MLRDDRTEAAVMDVMNKWRASHAARDIDAIMALYAPDPDVVVIGTGANERCVGPTEIKALHELEWSQSEAGSIEFGVCVRIQPTDHNGGPQ
jgi:ketosteroid isomerase-like protein